MSSAGTSGGNERVIRMPRSSGPARRPQGLGIAAVAVIAFAALARLGATMLTDLWWFDDLGHEVVWSKQLFTSLALFAIGAVVSLVLGIAIVRLVSRSAPVDAPDEAAARLRFVVGRRVRLAGGLAAAGFAMMMAPGLAQHTSTTLLFLNGNSSAGPKDPEFGRPLGFFLFTVPFLRALLGWLLALVLVGAVIATIASYLVGAWRPGQPGGQMPKKVRVLIGVLVAVSFLLRAAGYLVDRWQLLSTGSGYVDGPGATDLKTRLPGLTVLFGISLLVAIAVLIGAFRKDITTPVVAVIAWMVTAVLIGEGIPRAYRSIKVVPNTPSIELGPIERNLKATRAAYGLNDVKMESLYQSDAGAPRSGNAERSKVSQELASNARIWGPVDRTKAAFNKVSKVDYLQVKDVDMDRYVIDGREQLVAVGALDRVALPRDSWSQKHLVRTHGYGVMAAPAGEVAPGGEGEPRLVSTGLASDTLITKQPRLYIGENLVDYVVAGTASETSPVAKNVKDARYSGKKGVSVGGFFKKAIFAMRFGDQNLLIRSLPENAKVMYVRDVRKRAQKLAPFLRYDADPYPVVLADHVAWVLDGYSVTNNYPYAQRFDTSNILNPSSDLANGGFNSARSAVKVVMNAYDGSVAMYRTSPKGSDPILDAWAGTFPKLFRDKERLEKEQPGLSKHLRYPEDLFRLQSSALGRYHVKTAADFVDLTNDWTLSEAAPTTSSGKPSFTEADPAAETTARTGDRAQVDPDELADVASPLFLRHRYPNETNASFVLQQTLELRRTTGQRRLLRSIIVADSDPKNYGRIRMLQVPTDSPGQARAFDRMRANPQVSTFETQLGQVGSAVNFGDVQVLPTDIGIVYQRPMFLSPDKSDLQELKYVLVLAGDKVTIKPSVPEAFAAALTDGKVEPTKRPTASQPSSTVVAGSVAEQLDAAAAALEKADDALRAGNLGEYQTKVEEARKQIEAARSSNAPATTTTSTVPAA